MNAPLVLVLERDSANQRLIEVLLTRHGMRADVVGTVNEALLLVANVEYAAVVIDHRTAGAEWERLAGCIAEHRPELLARTLVLTSTMNAETHALREAHPQAVVVRKPFELAEMNEVLGGVLRNSEPPQPNALRDFYRHSVLGGAKAGLIVRLRIRGGVQLEHLASFGYTATEIEQWFPLPADATLPICAAVRRARPVYLASLNVAADEYPQLGPVWQQYHSQALAALPIFRAGRVVGAAGWSFSNTRRFSATERDHLAGIAELAAVTLDSAVETAPSTAC